MSSIIDHFHSIQISEFKNQFPKYLKEYLNTNNDINYFINQVFKITTLNDIINYFSKFTPRRQCLQRLKISYRCTTCYGKNVIICNECFNRNEHIGHKVQEYTNAVGYCDCGIFRNGGFNCCKKHLPLINNKEKILEKTIGENLEHGKEIVRIIIKTIQEYLLIKHTIEEWNKFSLFMDEISKIFQAEIIYQIFGEISSEIIIKPFSFIQALFILINSDISLPNNFIQIIAPSWFIPMAMHPAAYKHYKDFILEKYQNRAEFYGTTLYSIQEEIKILGKPKNHKEYKKLILVINECSSLYIQEDILKIKQKNEEFKKAILIFSNLINDMINNKKMLIIEDQYIIKSIIKNIIYFYINGKEIEYYKNILEQKLLVIKIIPLMEICDDEFIKMIIDIILYSNKQKIENLLDLIIEFCFNKKKINAGVYLMIKKCGENLSLPSVKFEKIELKEKIKYCKSEIDFMNINQCNILPFYSNQIGKEFNVIKLFSKMKEYKGSLIKFIKNEYPNIKNESILIIIVWFFHYEEKEVLYYISQNKMYEKYIKEEEEDITQNIKLNEIIQEQIINNNKIICNPFVPFAQGIIQNVYLLLCLLTNKIIGIWKTNNKIEIILKSKELTQLLIQSINEQPLFVIHVLWLRILYKISLPDDNNCFILFIQLQNFIKQYPFILNSIYKLSIEYDSVTPGTQKVFLETYLE
ncbi:hypothetical protein EDI_154570 [Entamoeba dispar SAW760]|uniref:E3 ubiquitin-protein ligase n=1 Tax=Entamoeba dispar (strain ATCC PRA-260 / SAW760) TaxID=370354 RepID=B0ECB1_ENTDS|nr:uncharacterized protein EDI_154570 [Entamoeba dispar SAW760]EDR27835.1 hypothetical protein EDI_154570 [Entamoeba dispar SAW760]|eukprot:EDR27835.1 hypothetical protein EDI_154570 [Entamoeba dispar SAW760]